MDAPQRNLSIELGIDPRYVVERELGHGAASTVYEVRDQIRAVRRALKIATRTGLVRRFTTEYQRLSEMRHPNVVRAYNFGVSSAGLPYYTMELVRGVAFSELPDRWDAEVLAHVAMQVLDALAMMHARGWVHRDIKPQNLLIVGHGTGALVRLLDLGLLTSAGSVVTPGGTLPYMAPEVARGSVVDGRADLFSLGVVLYESLCPSEMPATVEEAARLLTHGPTPPNRLNPAIPAGLSDLVMRLLAPDPDERFADADRAAEALSRVPGLHVGRGPSLAMAERMLRGGAVSHRDRAVARVRRWAKSAATAGHGGVCVVQGAIGVGKTPFLREVGTMLNLQGFRVIRLRATNEPGTPIPSLLAAARALRPHDVRLPDPGPIPFGSDSGHARVAEFAGRLGAGLAHAFEDRPTVVIIDDLHRAEPVSLEVLRSLGHELVRAPVLLVCAGDPRSDGLVLEDALGPDPETIVLHPLTRAEIARLVAHRLQGLVLPGPALERLAGDSQGMPSLVERTLARLVVDKTVQRSGVGFHFVGGRYRAARHEDTELVAARLARVRPAHRRALAAAAVLGHGLNAQTVAVVAEIPVDEAGSILAELARLQVLNAGEATLDPSYIFAARSIRAAVYQEIASDDRRRLHDRAAEVVAAGEVASGRTEERTEHLLKGSDDALAVAAAMDAGDRAAAVFADRRAIEYYARAYSRLSGPLDARGRPLALRLGKLFERGGELERAASWYQAAIGSGEVSDPGAEVDALLGLAEVSLLRGQVDDTAAQVTRALGILAQLDAPALQARAHRLEALVAMQRGELQRGEELLLRALGDLGTRGPARETMEVLLDLAQLAKQRGAIVQAVRYARRALHLARREGEPAAVAEAHTVLGRGFLRASRYGAARRSLSQALRMSRQAGDHLREAAVLREIGNLRSRQADFAGALERYNRSLELVRGVRAKAEESKCLHAIGVVNTALGNFRAALSALQAALEVANAASDVHGAAQIHAELGRTWALVGDLGRAAENAGRALEAAMGLGDEGLRLTCGGVLAEVALRAGDLAPARRLCDAVLADVERLEDPAQRGAILLHAAGCAVAAGWRDDAARLSARLEEEVFRGVLTDLEAASRGLAGMVKAHGGTEDWAAALLEEAVGLAAGEKLRPLEVSLRQELGQLLAGTDHGAEHLTRAMELARELARELPPDLAATYLQAPERQELRARFGREHQRIFAASSAAEGS